VHWARSAASAPDSLTAVCPVEKRREEERGGGTAMGCELARFSGCKNFEGNREKFIFDAFVHLKPMERFKNGSNMH